MSDQKGKVKQWYDGFIFGKHTDIYNPWSAIWSLLLASGYLKVLDYELADKDATDTPPMYELEFFVSTLSDK